MALNRLVVLAASDTVRDSARGTERGAVLILTVVLDNASKIQMTRHKMSAHRLVPPAATV